MARNLKDYKGPQKEREFEAPLLEPGNYPARLVSIVFLGTQKQQPFQGQEKDPHEAVTYTYELSHEFMVNKEGVPAEDKPRWFSEDLLVYGPEADKAKITLRNKAIDPGNSADGDVSALLSLPCNVLLVHKVGTGKHAGRTFERIGGVSAAAKMPGYVQPKLVNKTIYFDPFDAAACDLEVFKKFPEFVRKKIMSADDYHLSVLAKLLGNSTAPQEDNEDEPAAGTAPDGTDTVQEDNPW